MYESLKEKFPHLSSEDRIKIAEFVWDHEQKAIGVLWEKIAKFYAERDTIPSEKELLY